jgi:hypothetical protein
MPPPLFDVLLICHAASAIIGFGSLGISALMAYRGRVSREPGGDASIRRFFGEETGGDWLSRLVFAVPLLGFALLFGPSNGGRFFGQIWPWCGLALWTVAIGTATASLWPAERQARALLAGDDTEGFRAACRKMELAGEIVTICAFVALCLMIFQPG